MLQLHSPMGSPSDQEVCELVGDNAVLKQDGQKADVAEVPARLGDSMFYTSHQTTDKVKDMPPVKNWWKDLCLFQHEVMNVWRRCKLSSWTDWTLLMLQDRGKDWIWMKEKVMKIWRWLYIGAGCVY